MTTSARMTMLTRVGFAARGLLYIVIGFLVMRTGRAEDPSGALQYLGEGGGQILLIVMAAGLLTYGLWRVSDAALNIEHHDADRRGMLERAGAGVSGVVHLLLAWQAVRLIQGVALQGDSAQDGARTALALPGGGVILVLAAIALFAVGVFQLVKAVRASFLENLEPKIASQPWVIWSGRVGYAARGLIFMITSVFLLRAGLDEQASEAGSTAAALAWLSSPLDIIVAMGLFGFGLFSLVEARFRRLHALSMGAKLRQAVGMKQVR